MLFLCQRAWIRDPVNEFFTLFLCPSCVPFVASTQGLFYRFLCQIALLFFLFCPFPVAFSRDVLRFPIAPPPVVSAVHQRHRAPSKHQTPKAESRQTPQAMCQFQSRPVVLFFASCIFLPLTSHLLVLLPAALASRPSRLTAHLCVQQAPPACIVPF